MARPRDGHLGAWRSTMSQHVAADLAQRRLEERDRAVVTGAAHRIAEALNGLVEDVQSLIELGERSPELKMMVTCTHWPRSR